MLSPDKLPIVSVVLPVLNGRSLLPSFFVSLKSQTYPPQKTEVIIIDNGSQDKTVVYVRARHPQTRLISLDHNIGTAMAENLGCGLARGSLVFITNDDALLSPNCLADLVNLIESDPAIGMTCGKLLYQNPRGVLAWPGFKLHPYLAYYPYDLNHLNRVRASDWASGPAMLIRKAVFDRIGGFDPDYFFCGEDYDLSLRIQAAGYKITYCPTALIYHGFTRNRLDRERNFTPLYLYLHYRGKIRCVLKHATTLQKVTSLLFLFFAIPAYHLWLRPSGLPLLLQALFRAFVWNLYHLPKI